MKKALSYVILLSMHMSLHTYIYNAIVMRKWQADLNRFHYFIGLGDFHNKQHPANKVHLHELQQLLAYAQKDSLRILTEDLSVSNDIGRKGVKGFSINSRGGLLGGLTDMCRDMGIDVLNLEYRYARVCALGPVLNNLKDDPFSFDSSRKLLIGDLVEEVYSEIDRMHAYNDDPILGAWYVQCIKDVEKKISLYDWPNYYHQSVAEYVKQKSKSVISLMQKLLTFDAALLDVKIVHEVVQQPHIEHICAIAGGSHIDRASKMLKKVGYTSVWHAGYDGSNVAAIDAGPDAHKSEYGIKPAPISLHVLKKFF